MTAMGTNPTNGNACEQNDNRANAKETEDNAYDRYLEMQAKTMEDAIDEGRCFPEMPEGQFVRSK